MRRPQRSRLATSSTFVASDWERALELAASCPLGGEQLVTHRFALEDWQDAFATTQSG